MKRGVVAIIEKDGKILIGKKILLDGHPLSGTWHLPGGKLEEKTAANGVICREDEAIGLKREVKEETGLDVKIIKFLDESISEAGFHLKWFLCTADSMHTKPGDDLRAVKWVEKKDIYSELDKVAADGFPPNVKVYFSRY